MKPTTSYGIRPRADTIRKKGDDDCVVYKGESYCAGEGADGGE